MTEPAEMTVQRPMLIEWFTGADEDFSADFLEGGSSFARSPRS